MITVLDTGLGNLLSVTKALEKVSCGRKVLVSDRAADLEDSSHIVLPGVGNFRVGMHNLREMGLIEPLRKQVQEIKKPFLGICLGMQLLVETGEESGECEGLGFIEGKARRLESNGLPLPHLGWHDLEISEHKTLFNGVLSGQDYYFVHSFVLDCPEKYVSAYCTYGEKFVAAVHHENIFGVQFHPEKSRQAGLDLFSNFLREEECSKSVWFLSSC
ncbi:MAG: imidazole glycerol phosphate synthase subunit HisH [Proteobacteria bacterium]|nr:imidazole glycerol phosphate synthase subunit HisH [Pseudomonadota bacterium]MBU1738773.1 imidazole glycerol phosphate synthase subunit HisH [Pseudomonadota bacterium]